MSSNAVAAVDAALRAAVARDGVVAVVVAGEVDVNCYYGKNDGDVVGKADDDGDYAANDEDRFDEDA